MDRISRLIVFCALLTCGSLLAPRAIPAADWYLEGAGSGSPSIASLAGRLAPGDRVFLKRGGRFEGGFRLDLAGTAEKPIYIAAYGEGPRPLVSDLALIEGWEPAGQGVWRAPLPKALPGSTPRGHTPHGYAPRGHTPHGYAPRMLLQDGAALPLARYPNPDAAWSGYLEITGHRGKVSLKGDFPREVDWRGAEVVVRSRRWILDRVKVKSSRGGAISFDEPLSYEPYDGWGFFLQNHPAALDREGEWCVDAATGTILLKTSGDPRRHEYFIPAGDCVADFSKSRHLVIDGIAFRGGNDTVLRLDRVEAVSIIDCEIGPAGTDGLSSQGARKLRIEDSAIVGVQNNAVLVGAVEDCVFRANRIERTALVAGMGRGRDGQYNALAVNGRDIRVEGNLIRDTGYLPVDFRGDDILIADNRIERYAIVKDDAGGIYTWSDGARPSHNLVVRGNLVRDGIGAPDGQRWAGLAVKGIYMDDRSNDILIQDNVLINTGEYGIFIHNARDILIEGNLVAGAGHQLSLAKDAIAPEFPVSNVRVRNNRFVAMGPDQGLVKELNSWASEPLDVSFDGNEWAAPFRGVPLFIRTLKDRPLIEHDPALWAVPGGHDPSGQLLALEREAVLVKRFGPTVFAAYGEGEAVLDRWQYWASEGNGRVTRGPLAAGSLPEAVLAQGRTHVQAKQTLAIAIASVPTQSVRMSFSNASGKDGALLLYNSPLFTVEKGTWLSLSFFARVVPSGKANRAPLSFLLRKGAEPWTQASAEYSLRLSRDWQAYRLLVPVERDEEQARAEFRIAEALVGTAIVEIAGIALKRLDVDLVDPAKHFTVLVNEDLGPLAKARDYRLEAGWRPLFPDPGKEGAGGTISLDPLEGVVLWKE